MNAPQRARDLERPQPGPVGAHARPVPRADLRELLTPFAAWLERDDVDALFVQRPGEVWIDVDGLRPFVRDERPDVDDALLARIAGQVGRACPQATGPRVPLRTTTLADGARLQVVGPSITQGHWALAICRPRIDDLGLLSYTRRPVDVRARAIDTIELAVDDPIDALQRAVFGRATILVSGGESSGRTTFLGALLRNVPDTERVVVVEDARELRLHGDHVLGLAAVGSLAGEQRVGPAELLPVALRLRPDRLVLGELAGPETLPFLRAVLAGQPGSLATIRADSPREALGQVAVRLRQAGLGFTHAESLRYAASAIDLVVQLDRRGSYRRVEQIAIARDLVA